MHTVVVTSTDARNPLRSVMKALPLAESGVLGPSERRSLLPDVAVLRRRVRRVALLSAAFREVRLSPHVERLAASARVEGSGEQVRRRRIGRRSRTIS